MFREHCTIVDHRTVAPGHWAVTFRSPRIAAAARPGQFVQIVCSDSSDPLLPRPFSFLSASKRDFSVIYHVVGKGTRLLSRMKKGGKAWVTGPLGRGFHSDLRRRADRVINTVVLVGGGVGIPPLYHAARELCDPGNPIKRENVHVLLGARTKDFLLCEKDFKKLGVSLKVATDDGSRGRKGLVTLLLEDALKRTNPVRTRVMTCGPTPMLKAVARVSAAYRTPCQVSVEVPMACGFGACIGCAIKVKAAPSEETPGPDYRFAIACQEGPVFRGEDVVWE